MDVILTSDATRRDTHVRRDTVLSIILTSDVILMMGREVRDADVRAHSRVVTSLSGEFTDAGRN